MATRRGSAPTKREVLGKLLDVLEAQEAETRRLIAERNAREATDESVLNAIRRGEHTWKRLHAFFPERQWKALGEALSRLQRSERVHRDEWLDFRLGPRKRTWSASRGYGNKRPKRASRSSRRSRPTGRAKRASRR